MSRIFTGTALSLTLLIIAFAGCQTATDTGTTTAQSDAHDHDHEHEHDHGPAGPNGGHTETFDQPGYTFEWIHDDTAQLVKIVILDESQKEAVAVAAESLTLTSNAGQEPQVFTLAAVSPDEEGKASAFETKDGALIVALGLGVDVSVEIDGTQYTKKIEPHNHDH
jgi:hypothetical protein